MASTATQKGNRGQLMARDVLKKWTHKKMKSSSQSGMPGYNHDPHKGDILCDTEGHFFPFTVEVKFYKDINFCQLLQPNLKNVLILEFWHQVAFDAHKCQKVPMLMMRFNGLPKNFFFVVVRFNFYIQIKQVIGELKTITYQDGKECLVIMDSTDLFESNYKEVKKIAKTQIKTLYK